MSVVSRVGFLRRGFIRLSVLKDALDATSLWRRASNSLHLRLLIGVRITPVFHLQLLLSKLLLVFQVAKKNPQRCVAHFNSIFQSAMVSYKKYIFYF